MAKKNTIIIYILLIVCMATATIVEKYKGTEVVFNKIYGAWWFAALWAIGVAFAIFYFLERKVAPPIDNSTPLVVCRHPRRGTVDKEYIIERGDTSATRRENR
jgi:hypothetical protein